MSDDDSDSKNTDEFNKSAGNPPSPYEFKKTEFQKGSELSKTADKLESKHHSDDFNSKARLKENTQKPETGKSAGSTQVKKTNVSAEGPSPPTGLKNAGARKSHHEALAKDANESGNKNTEKSDLSPLEEARRNKENGTGKNKTLSDEFNSKSKK